MARPFISVLVDTYNHKRYIEEALYRGVRRKMWADLQPSHVDRTGQWTR